MNAHNSRPVALLLSAVLLLAGCSLLPHQPQGASSNGDEAPSLDAPPIAEEPPAGESSYATPYALQDLGYHFVLPEDIGVYDTNETDLTVTPQIIQKTYPHLLWTTPSATDNRFEKYHAYGVYGSGNLWGSYTVLSPNCLYVVPGSETSVCFSLLQAFRRSELEAPGAQIEFLQEEIRQYPNDRTGRIYTHYGLPVAEVEAYRVYADEEIVVYDFFPFTNAPPLEEQLEELAQEWNYQERGIDLTWPLELRDAILERGVGSFIQKTD